MPQEIEETAAQPRPRAFSFRVPRAHAGWGGFAAALAALFLWALGEPMVPGSLQIVGDVTFGVLVGVAAFGAAWYSRTARAADERNHLVALEELSRRDELSGLHNYRYLRESMRAELITAAEGSTPLAVIMLDLNDFKDVNDRFGHQAGDALIVAIGRAASDEVAGRGAVARYGGDEFTVLLPDTDRAGAEEVAADVAEAIARASLAATDANRHLRVTASYGIAVYPQDAEDAESLIASADRALYEAKAQLTEVRARTDERHAQDVFFAVGEAIGTSLESSKLLPNLVRAVGESLNIDACSIWLVQEGKGEVWPKAYWMQNQEFARSLGAVMAVQPFTLEEATGRGLLGTQTLYVDDISASDVLADRFRAMITPETWLISVPMHEPRAGFFMLSSRHATGAPPSNALAEAISRLAVSALQNADSYARAAAQVEQLKALAGIGGLLLGDNPYGERLDNLVCRVAEVTACDMLTLDTEDPSGEQEFVRQFCGHAADGGPYDEAERNMWLELRMPLEGKSARDLFASMAEPIVMDDPVNQVPELYRPVILSSGTKSVAVMPIAWRGELKGLFYFASYRKNAFNARDIALMQAIASQIAPAIEVASLNEKLERSYGELKDSYRDAIQRLAYAAEARDPYTGRYLQRIAALSEAIARRIGLDEDAVEAIGYAAVVHDLGKLKIPDDIMTKPGELTTEDWAVMKQHPEFGAELLGTGMFYDVARTVALHHHERWDGTGYPFGLKGEDIPLEARIVAVADVYDALISARPYKHAWPRERALAELLKIRAVKLCPQSIDAFLQLWTEGEIARIEAATEDANFTTDFQDRRAA
jgi:diguanylate cyclase (GGDEF)-like protein